MRYNFDWDPNKEQTNFRKHGVSFRRAATVFRDPNQQSIYDEEHSLEEDRWITIGLDSNGILRVVIHTFEQINEALVEFALFQHEKQRYPKLNNTRKGLADEDRIRFF